MCVHEFVMLEAGTREVFFFACRRCQTLVSLQFAGGVLHASADGDRVSPLDVELLVSRLLDHYRGHPSVPRRRRRRAPVRAA